MYNFYKYLCFECRKWEECGYVFYLKSLSFDSKKSLVFTPTFVKGQYDQMIALEAELNTKQTIMSPAHQRKHQSLQ
jgi:hypothetical protein